MCGIAGCFRFRDPAPEDTEVVREMTARLVRRGPDDEGVEQDGPVTLGNRRLAILDLTDAGHQPMRSGDGRYLITFNGEIYNFRELRQELGVAEARSGTDTEVLLLAWERWGEEALPRLVGQFAFAVYDRREERLVLARDRFGEKPLFYHLGADTLVFASSIAALLRAPGVPRELDPDAIAEFVTLRYVVSPRTVVSGVSKLPGGHLLEASREGTRVRCWYDARFRRPADNGARRREDLVEEFDALLAQASERCLVSDVPVALLLSDGIDSHSVRASLRRSGHDVPSFTYRMSASGSRLEPSTEEPGTTDLFVTPEERVDSMEPAFGSFGEPVGDGASLATWLLIHHARERATVFLCGHGGDEVLGGYRLSQDRFRLAALKRLAWLPEAWTRGTMDRFLYGAEPLSERRQRFRRSPARRAPVAARYLIHRPLPVTDVEELLAGDVSGYLDVVDRLYLRDDDSAGDIDRIQEVMLRTFLSENILSFADSVAMDSSAELRMPYLDRDLVEFVLSLPPEARVSRWPGRANTKQIQRWWGQDHLSPEITTRRKRTFNFGNLPELLRTQGERLHGWTLGSAPLRRALPGLENWLGHPPEYFRGPWEGTLWALLSLGIWCEHAGIE